MTPVLAALEKSIKIAMASKKVRPSLLPEPDKISKYAH